MIDKYLSRVRSKDYNCVIFVMEVWEGLFGVPAPKVFTKCLVPSEIKKLTFLTKPVSPCFVIMQRPKYVPHIGIYLNGRILHLTDTGAAYQTIKVATRIFTNVRYCL